MLEAAIIGRWRSTPGVFSMRRRIRLLRRFNWRWTLAFTRKPPGGERTRLVKYLDCSPEPGGFRASRPRSASDYAWFRVNCVEWGRLGSNQQPLVDGTKALIPSRSPPSRGGRARTYDPRRRAGRDRSVKAPRRDAGPGPSRAAPAIPNRTV